MPFAAAITVRSLARSELPHAALLAALAMRDNPMHVASMGPDPHHRVQVMESAFERHLRAGERVVLSAWEDNQLVGIAAYAASGRCCPTPFERLRMAPVALRAGRSARRLLTWQGEWARRDPPNPHAHLGPVAVVAERQGCGIGGALLAAYTTVLDRNRLGGYLETDKKVNVEFYERFGFEVVDRADVLGVPNWFMVRAAHGEVGPAG